MNNANRDIIKNLKDRYRKGMKVRLVQMDDPQAPPVGTIGEIQGVDDLGSILVSWSNGSTLSLIPGADKFEKIL